MAIDVLFKQVRDAGGSDLHLEVNQRPKMRHNGQIVTLNDNAVLNQETLAAWLKEVTPPQLWERLQSSGDCEFACDLDGRSRLRMNCYRDMHGYGAVGRLIPLEIPSWEQLGLPAVLKDVLDSPSGLLVVTGPSGCGKSTTVAALLDHINANQSKRIMTVENPIEFVHVSKKSLILQREVGVHTRSLHAELRSHQDFDVMFIGELENSEIVSCALNAVESGILVIATLRGSNTSKALDHIVSGFAEDQRQWVRTTLSTCMRCVCAQALIVKADGSGRCAVNEILIGNSSVAAALRDDHIAKLGGMIQSGGQDGMITMDDALMRKIEAKVIRPADALAKASDKNRFQMMIQQPKAEEPPPAPTPAPAPTPQVARR